MENEQQEETPVNEIEVIKQENDRLKGGLKAGEEKIAGLEKALAEKDREIITIQKIADEAKQASVKISGELSEAKTACLQAVTAYKELVGQANPGPVAEMLAGNTIAEINASLKSARGLVEKVRQDIGAETARVRVPAGAPVRTMPDLSALTAREKIKYGIEGG